jgi:hypothetical protein
MKILSVVQDMGVEYPQEMTSQYFVAVAQVDHSITRKYIVKGLSRIELVNVGKNVIWGIQGYNYE